MKNENTGAIVPPVVQAPIGEVGNSGVVWFNQNPHAYPLGTKFYAAPIVATVPSEQKPIARITGAELGYLKNNCIDELLPVGTELYTAPSPTEQASDVRNALIDECALVADNAICTCCWSEDAQAAATHIADEIRELKSATPADKGCSPSSNGNAQDEVKS